MKKTTLFLSALLVCVALTGCASKPKETEVQTEVQTEPVTTAQTETEVQTEVQTEPATEVQDSMNRTRKLKGLVKAADTSSLTIQTERGKELKFSISGADVQAAGGIQTGNNVEILYKGSIEGTDTSKANVQIIKDLASGETPVTEGELMTEAEEANPEAGAGTLEGTIDDVNTDRIVILANDGDYYYFSMYGTDMNLKNGVQKGNYVTVNYNGDLFGPDLVTATSITDAQTEGEKAAYGASEGEGYSYMNGTLIGCTPDTTTIITDDEEEVTFNTTGAPQVYLNGIQYGNYITVEYTGTVEGTDTAGATVTAVYDYPEDGSSVPEDYNEDEGQDEGTADEGSVEEVPETEVQA